MTTHLPLNSTDHDSSQRSLGFEYKRADIEPAPGPFLDSLPLSRPWIPEAALRTDPPINTAFKAVGTPTRRGRR